MAAAKFTLTNIRALQLMQTNNDPASGVCITPTTGGMSVDGNVDIGRGLSVGGLGHFTGGVSISGGASIGPLFIGDTITNVTDGRVLIINGADGQIGTSAFPAGGGGGGAANPAGSTTQIQYNDGSNQFGADASFTWSGAAGSGTSVLGVSGSISVLGGPITLDTVGGLSSVRILDNTTNQGGEIILYGNGTSIINLVADGFGGDNFIQLNDIGGGVEAIRLETTNTTTGTGPALLLTNTGNTSHDVELVASGLAAEEGELRMFTKDLGSGTSTISVNLRAGKKTGEANKSGGILELNRLDTTTGNSEQIITLDSTTREIYINHTSGASRAVLDGSTGSGRLRLRDTSDKDRVELVGVSGGIILRNGGGVSTFIGVSSQPTTGALRFILPASLGSAGQVLSTDGSGNLSYTNTNSFGVSELGELNDAYTDASNIILGPQPKTTTLTGFNNTAVGISALLDITSGTSNTVVGYNAGEALTTGNANVAIGDDSLNKDTVGFGSVAIGNRSLFTQSNVAGVSVFNTAVGYDAGNALTTGTSCTFIGASSGGGAITGTNITCLGFGAQPSTPGTSNEVTLGNNQITTLRCADQTIASLSDARDKNDIRDLSYGLNFLENVRPVEFTWDRRVLNPDDKNDPKQGKRRAGFIAQELQEAMPEGENDILDLVYTSNPQRLEAKYGNLIPVMVKAIQDLKQEVDTIKEHLNLE